MSDNKVDETSFENERAGTADAVPKSITDTMKDPQVRHAGVRPSTPRDQEFFAHSEDGPREVASEEFHVPVADVLSGAAEENFSSVVVVGLDHEGKIVVAGSHGTPLVKDLLKQGSECIDKLAMSEEEADRMEADPDTPASDFVEKVQGSSHDNGS